MGRWLHENVEYMVLQMRWLRAVLPRCAEAVVAARGPPEIWSESVSEVERRAVTKSFRLRKENTMTT
jgi:hypothetical protein